MSNFLVQPITLTTMIHTIEYLLPGWWWSISQMSSGTTVSVGPTESCPDSRDRAYLRTSEGDRGLRHHIDTLDPDNRRDESLYYAKALDSLILKIRVARISMAANMSKSALEDLPIKEGGRAAQTYLQRSELRVVYKDLVENVLPALPTEFELTELYLGVCSLSVDSSLRGVGSCGYDYRDYDVSRDLKGDASLADSLRESCRVVSRFSRRFLGNK